MQPVSRVQAPQLAHYKIPGHIAQLPRELLEFIFSTFFTDQQKATLNRVCRHWYKVINLKDIHLKYLKGSLAGRIKFLEVHFNDTRGRYDEIKKQKLKDAKQFLANPKSDFFSLATTHKPSGGSLFNRLGAKTDKKNSLLLDLDAYIIERLKDSMRLDFYFLSATYCAGEEVTRSCLSDIASENTYEYQGIADTYAQIFIRLFNGGYYRNGDYIETPDKSFYKDFGNRFRERNFSYNKPLLLGFLQSLNRIPKINILPLSFGVIDMELQEFFRILNQELPKIKTIDTLYFSKRPRPLDPIICPDWGTSDASFKEIMPALTQMPHVQHLIFDKLHTLIDAENAKCLAQMVIERSVSGVQRIKVLEFRNNTIRPEIILILLDCLKSYSLPISIIFPFSYVFFPDLPDIHTENKHIRLYGASFSDYIIDTTAKSLSNLNGKTIFQKLH